MSFSLSTVFECSCDRVGFYMYVKGLSCKGYREVKYRMSRSMKTLQLIKVVEKKVYLTSKA